MFFFFNDTATTEIYTLSLHDALPISEIYAAVVDDVEWLVEQGCKLIVLACNSATIAVIAPLRDRFPSVPIIGVVPAIKPAADRKSTRLNSSHANISYAVFCLKKKTKL